MIYLGTALAVAILLIGILGTIIPMMPGLPLMWIVYAVYGYFTGWETISFSTTIIFLLVTVIAYLFDYAATVAGAKKFGAGKAGMIGSFLGLILGMIFFNVPGLIIGPIIGAIIGELAAGQQTDRAVLAGWGTFLGFLASTVVRFSIALIYFFYFILKLF